MVAEIEDLGDVRVLDARRDARLVEKHSVETGITRKVRQDGLDRDELLEAMFAALPRDPHARHAALCDRAQEFVAIELIARRKRGGVEGGACH